jgi:hypothetical protein
VKNLKKFEEVQRLAVVVHEAYISTSEPCFDLRAFSCPLCYLVSFRLWPFRDFGTPTYEHPSNSYASSPLQPLTLDPPLLQSLDNVSFTSLLPPSEDQMVSTPSSPYPLSHSLTDHVSFSHLLQDSYICSLYV